MRDHSEAFVAITPAATAKLVRKLAGQYERVAFCYEAGPTGIIRIEGLRAKIVVGKEMLRSQGLTWDIRA